MTTASADSCRASRSKARQCRFQEPLIPHGYNGTHAPAARRGRPAPRRPRGAPARRRAPRGRACGDRQCGHRAGRVAGHRRHRPRHRPPRHLRPRGGPATAGARLAGADPHAHGARRDRGPGRGPRCGRRRLPREALRRRGAVREGAGPGAARPGAGDGRPVAGCRSHPPGRGGPDRARRRSPRGPVPAGVRTARVPAPAPRPGPDTGPAPGPRLALRRGGGALRSWTPTSTSSAASSVPRAAAQIETVRGVGYRIVA